MKKIVLNEGSQREFVLNDQDRYLAYIGGLGSGKTFAGLVRGINFAMQPKPPGQRRGARGVAAAISYPVLLDVVLPQFFDIVEGTDLLERWQEKQMKATMKGGGEILFRSLDNPNKLRGLELSWFFIDEGRHVTRMAWDILIGRLRQKGFRHGGWVCSTPEGYNWMYDLFHEESAIKWPAAKWYGASTYANARHLPEEYIRDLEASYSGKFFEQEVLGHFVGLQHGAVFPEWDRRFLMEVPYNPNLPLYSFWDFGIGDIGIVIFAQVDWIKKTLPNGDSVEVPRLLIIDVIEAADWNAKQWADAWKEWLALNTGGRRPDRNFGDPAGKARTHGSGTSVIDDLAAAGVQVTPALKKPPDYGIRILRNMMEGARVIADESRCTRLGAAFSTHKWPTDANGQRVGTQPVHDWTSHYASAARYGVTGLFSFWPKRTSKPPEPPPPPGSVGDVTRKLLKRDSNRWLGSDRDRMPTWRPSEPIGV